MNVASPPIKEISAAYQVSRQRLFQMRVKHDLSLTELCDPDRIFQIMLTGNSSKLRSRLADPITRASIKRQLQS